MNTRFLPVLILIFGSGVTSAQTFVNENFNSGMPSSWTVVTMSCGNSSGDSTRWEATVNGWRGNGPSNSVDGTEFAIVDSDLPGTFCNADEQLITPAFNAASATSIFLEFDMVYKAYVGDYGDVDVFDGNSWVTVAHFAANYGTWMAPNHQNIDISAYVNANMQVRFHYVANYDWYWAVDNVNIYVPAAFPVTVSSTMPLCYGDCNGSATATPTGGVSPYTYLWNDPASQMNATAIGLCAGTYQVTVVDNIGDSVISMATLADPLPVSLTDSMINPLCTGDTNGSATVYATGGTTPFSYLWNNGPVTAMNSNIGAGSYTVLVADGNNCVASDSVILTDPAPIAISDTTVAVGCFGDSTGSATVMVSGGATPYSFLWSNGVTQQTNPGLASGNYLVTVTDQNGCTQTAATTVTEPSTITVSTSLTDVLCHGDSSGSVAVTASGGSPGYSYIWNTGGTTSVLTGVPAGTYFLTVTDTNNCTAIDSMVITETTAIALAASTTQDDGSCNGSATVNVTGGTIPYSYAWSNGATIDPISGLCAGNYCVTVTDANGCTADTCVAVAVGLGETVQRNLCSIYPNPGNGRFSLMLKLDHTEQISCIVTDMTGRQLKVLFYQAGSGVLPLDLSSLPAGQYFVGVSGGGWQSNIRLVIM